ncbi:hypothetical protein [Flavobacterium sp. 2]|uniref:hypothetical protein n=1 Tax=Flavobacterium sp. 2 TaxID=308053 RepID=UPI003CE7B6D9
MPWYNGDYPPSYKNQSAELREKAVEIANALLLDGAEEGMAIATGLKQARELLKNYKSNDEDNLLNEKLKQNMKGKSIEEATDPSKLDKI